MPFNRKLLGLQGGFTRLTIIAFGVLTPELHERTDARRTRCPCLSLFYRNLLDSPSYGRRVLFLARRVARMQFQFVIRHILLTALFSALALTYPGLFGAGLAES